MRDVSILKNNGVNVEKSLELFGDMETYDDTLTIFLTEVEKKISEIKAYKEVEDLENYAILAHSLKTDAKYFGFEKLAEIAYEHELQSKDKKLSYILENFDEFLNETNKIIDLSKKYLNNESEATSSEPIAEIKIESETFNEAKVIEVSQSPATNKKTILVVDDSELIRDYIYKSLINDFDVALAKDGKEAISIIENTTDNRIICMLLDLLMPNMNGFAVLDYFQNKDLFQKIPVSIISGNDTKDMVERAFAYSIVDMLQKPFDEEQVKRIVNRTINFNR